MAFGTTAGLPQARAWVAFSRSGRPEGHWNCLTTARIFVTGGFGLPPDRNHMIRIARSTQSIRAVVTNFRSQIKQFPAALRAVMCHPRSVVALPFAARLRAIVLAVGFGCGSGVPSPAIEPVRPFESLRGWASPNTTIQSVAIDPNEGSCRVTAIVTHPPANDRVAVWIALPLKGWNGRFWGTGGSAWAGGSPESLGPRVREGYVVGATDTGHEGRSASFARDGQNRLDWQAIRDNAYLGIHDMTILGKALAEELYGQPPRHAYFYGGSTGGRQGLAEAQRYPGDYDGVVALFPSIHRDRYVPRSCGRRSSWSPPTLRVRGQARRRDRRRGARLRNRRHHP